MMEVIPKFSGGLRLFYNENLFLPLEYYRQVMEAITESDIRFYPMPWADRLVQALSIHLNIDKGAIFPGAGADDILRILMLRSECIGIIEPTYSLYEHLARSLGKEVRILIYKELMKNARKLEGCDIIIINSPNNPTGHIYAEDAVDMLSSYGTLVIDEAYIEFSGGEGYLKRALEGGVIVVRTFSKAWGLAGLRVGYAVASPDYVEELKGYTLPFQISSTSEAIAIKALQLKDVVDASIEAMKSVRDWFEMELEVLGLLYMRSKANFTLIAHPLAKRIWEGLRAKGIETRLIQRPGLKSGVRITIAPKDIMIDVLEVIKCVMKRD